MEHRGSIIPFQNFTNSILNFIWICCIHFYENNFHVCHFIGFKYAISALYNELCLHKICPTHFKVGQVPISNNSTWHFILWTIFFFKFHFITANYVKNRRIMQKMEDSNPWTQVLLCKLGLTSKVTHKSADTKSYTVWYSQLKSWFHIVPTPTPPPWRVLPYFGMVGRFCNDDPRLLDLRSNWGSHFMPQHNLIDPLFLQKKLVCLYHM